MILPAALLLQAAAVPDPEAVAPAITVVARRRRCDVSIADHILSDREFAARAAEWAAGEPLHVMVPRQTGYRCLAKITFRLSDHGVKRFVFEDTP